MIIDHRTYLFHPQQAATFVKLIEDGGKDVIAPMLPHLRGFFITEVGRLNEVVHLYAYDSFEQRAAIRAQVRTSPGFPDFAARVTPLLVSQESKLLLPVSFSPIGNS